MVDIRENYNIKNESTFRIGGSVRKVAFPCNVDELIELLKSDEYDYVLGNCSNILFSSDNINKNIILTKNLTDFRIDGDMVYVSCGSKGPVVSKACADSGLTGFEFLIGFPGSFGGMIYMNASAHNQAIADTFVSARVFNKKTKSVETLNKEEMNFSYRCSKISCIDYIVLDAIFKLNYGSIDEIKETMAKNKEFRKNRQPSLSYGNAGSIFKNPANDSAGRLLDLCNFKGCSIGGAKVFDNHANFIINYDNATSYDVLSLMYKMHNNVKEKYKISLKPEVIYIGDSETKEYKLWEIMSENIQ